MTLARLLATLVAFALVAIACGGDDTTSEPGDAATPRTVRLLAHDSFAVSDDVLDGFTADTGIAVEILRGGDAGTVVNQAILTKDNPTADVLFGVDNTLLSRTLDEGLFVAYQSPAVADVHGDLALDPEHRVTPIDFGDVCLNYDRDGLAATGIDPPQGLADLVKPEFSGKLVVQDPATSSPGLAFLLATIGTYGEDGDYTWRDYWADLVANDVLVTSGWEEAYYGAFSGGSGEGSRPIVVSYASSPPAEVIFTDPPPEIAPTVSIPDGCFRQIEFAGILNGTENEAEARLLIDFMLSQAFQDDIPLNMFVFPALTTAVVPPVFLDNTTIPDQPVVVSPGEISANRERWIQEWTDVMR